MTRFADEHSETTSSFLRPTRAVFRSFLALLVVVNVAIVLVSAFLPQRQWLALYQPGWLYAAFLHWGLADVEGPGELLRAPNALGWVLVLAGSLTTLGLYYVLACLIARRVTADGRPKHPQDR